MPRALAVDTASQSDSVWQDVGWNDFRQHIVTLQRTSNEVPSDPLVYSAIEWQAAHQESDHVERALPFDVEQRLADDIAFLAAAEEGAYGVSAVALEEQDEPGGLIVRLAANQVIPRGVEKTLRAMFDLLHQCSSRKFSRDTCRESLFDLVMTVSQNRILGRLQSVHWKRPKGPIGAKARREPLSVGLRKVVTRIERHRALDRVEKESLQNRMRHLCGLLERVDGCGKGTLECGHLLREIVKESYEMCTSAGTATLEETVKRHGFVKSELSSTKYIRQVDKIGRYWGMCCSMTEDARKYSTIFASIRLVSLRPYQAKSSDIAFIEGRSIPCFVHAEIQILVFYAMMPNAALRKPRVIGVSKSACYLCNLFIHEHGRFFITKTHGRLYERWTVPDLKDFDPRERVRFRRVLAAVDGQLRTALVIKAGARRKKREYPMGSWLTLPPPRPLSPVPSTVRSLASNDRTESDRRHVGPSIARELQEVSPPPIRPLPTSPLGVYPPPAHTPGPTNQMNTSPAHTPGPTNQMNTSPAHKSPPPPESSYVKPAVESGRETSLSSSSTASWERPAHEEFTAVAPVRTRIGRTSLTFETEGAARGTVAIARTSDGKNPTPATSIDIGALQPGEVKKFAREAESDHVSLNLNQGQGQSIQITLRWLSNPGSDASPTD